MDTVDIARYFKELDDKMNIAVESVKHKMDKDFSTTSKMNDEAAFQADAHGTMVDFLISSKLNAVWKKAYDRDKKSLDIAAKELGIDSEGEASVTKEVYSFNSLLYKKRQNKDGVTTLLTDFVNSLSRCDVSKETIDKAMKMSEKPKKGATYYIVELNES